MRELNPGLVRPRRLLAPHRMFTNLPRDVEPPVGPEQDRHILLAPDVQLTAIAG